MFYNLEHSYLKQTIVIDHQFLSSDFDDDAIKDDFMITLSF